MLLSFGKTVLWVTGISVWLVWWLRAASPDPIGFAIGWTSLFGGLIFGIGAVFNKGCAIATLKRLGNGNLGMLITLTAFALGVGLIQVLDKFVDIALRVHARPWLELQFGFATALGVVITIWMLWEFVRLWRSASDRNPRTIFLAQRYRLSAAAAIIGISNGLLYGLHGTWSYTHTLGRSVRQLVTPDSTASAHTSMALLWWLFLALIIGVVASAILNRRFALVWRPNASWRGYFGGGLLMGSGAALVPGGNDVLLLNAIPGMSPHAIPAYVAMLVGVMVGLVINKRRGRELGVVDCRNDVCLDSTGRQST